MDTCGSGDKNALIEGMNVTAGINIGDHLTSAVLTSAIISNAGNAYIFIRDAAKESDYKIIQIKRGVTNGSFTEITPLQSIPENVKVVTNSAFYLMAMLNAPQPDEQ